MSRDSSLPTPFVGSNDALDLFARDDERPAVGLSLDRIRQIGPLQFVEAVAVVQAVCAGVSSPRGIPELSGIFLTEFGDVIASGPPSGAPAARQAARLLHELVSPEATPAAGRLFIGRWTGSDSASLSEFTSELAYFARPNGPELRASIYAHSAGHASLPPGSPSVLFATPAAPVPRPTESPEPSPAPEDPRTSWIHSHRRQVIGATAVGAAVLAAGLTVWIWPSSAAGEQPARSQTQGPDSQTEETTGQSTPVTAATTRTAAKAAAQAANPPSRARNSSPQPLPRTAVLETGAVPATDTTPLAADVLAAGSLPLAAFSAKASRDTRVYTAADSGVEPPVLLSAEIPEWLIQGFTVRQNSVEILIDDRGEVQRVRMLGAPQRMPDVMLLSRAKEWSFRPATKDGIAVRYRLILSWNVTP